MVLRDATPADAPVAATIYGWWVEHGTASFEEIPPPVEEMAARMAAVADHGLPWLIAEADGRPLGYAYAAPFRPRSAYRYTVEDSVYVAPGEHGRGVGRALLEEVIGRCRALGLRQMIAAIGGAEPASIRLHERCGFRQAGVYDRVGVKFGRELDVVLMQRGLAPGAA